MGGQIRCGAVRPSSQPLCLQQPSLPLQKVAYIYRFHLPEEDLLHLLNNVPNGITVGSLHPNI